MPERLTKIEQQLLVIDSGTFERLCDEYLYLVHGTDFRNITQTGLQPGRQQTVRGTPDSYVILPNGRYVLIEYTKQQTGILDKLSRDLRGCLDRRKTGLDTFKIERIVLMHGSKLLPAQQEKLRLLCPSEIGLEIIGLNQLALAIHIDYPQLARRYLGISYSSLQILTPDEFVEEQDRRAVGKNNPLSNPIREQEKELKDLVDTIASCDVTVVVGSQGTGKTRLSLEAIRLFTVDQPSYKPFCITSRDAPLIEDLSDLVLPGRGYVFLIDDANRQIPNLLRTLDYISAKPTVSFKVVLTVRDYAFNVVTQNLKNYSHWKHIRLNRLTDHQIITIVEDEPFCISNRLAQDRILYLANGNPRLAIMAAKRAIDIDSFLNLNDATELYVSFYDNLTDHQNQPLLSSPDRLKVLGLLSVFRLIDLLDDSFVDQLTSTFGISKHTLVTELAGLESDELANVFLIDNSLYRTADQNLATYAVYQVFIDKKLLSVDDLLREFFESYAERIRDAFFGVINVFDKERITADLRLVTADYYASIQHDDKKAYNFLSIFYFAIPTETLTYFNELADKLTAIQTGWAEETFLFEFMPEVGPLKDRLQLLFNFFSNLNEYFDDALELLVKFAEHPSNLNNLLRKLITDRLTFEPSDFEHTAVRQFRFLDYLITEANSGNEAVRHLLFAILPFFLQSTFASDASRGRSVVSTTVKYPLYAPFNFFRRSLWEFVQENFAQYYAECRAILTASRNSSLGRENAPLYEFDQAFMIPLIEQYLYPDQFEDCHFVNQYVETLSRNGLESQQTDQLAKRFQNREYKLFLQLEWYIAPYRSSGGDAWINTELYELKRKDELLQSLAITSLANAEQLFDDAAYLKERPESTSTSIERSLALLMSNLSQRNAALFKTVMKSFSQREWAQNFNLTYLLQIVFEHPISDPGEWITLFTTTQYNQAEWRMFFFKKIAPEAVTLDIANKLSEFLKTQTESRLYINYLWWVNYQSVWPTIYRDILTILSGRYEQEKLSYEVDEAIITKQSERFSDADVPLLKKVYLQLFEIHGQNPAGFDHSNKGLKTLIDLDPTFLLDFVKAYYTTDRPYSHRELSLSFVWQLPDPVKWALSIVNLMLTEDWKNGRQYGSLFSVNHESDQAPLDEFITLYIQRYSKNLPVLDYAFDAIREKNIAKWDECIRLFLTHNTSIEAFEQIHWAPTSYFGPGNANFDEMKAEWYNRALVVVRQMQRQMPYLKHRQYLEKRINYYQRAADRERRRQFSQDDY